MTAVMPGASTSRTTINAYGSTAYARTATTSAPTLAVPMVFPNSTLVIKAFKGTKQEDAPNAYDARSVMKYLGPQIGIEQSKK
jgi:undecaprenyl pyrophosphate phosphatase UppP